MYQHRLNNEIRDFPKFSAAIRAWLYQSPSMLFWLWNSSCSFIQGQKLPLGSPLLAWGGILCTALSRSYCASSNQLIKSFITHQTSNVLLSLIFNLTYDVVALSACKKVSFAYLCKISRLWLSQLCWHSNNICTVMNKWSENSKIWSLAFPPSVPAHMMKNVSYTNYLELQKQTADAATFHKSLASSTQCAGFVWPLLCFKSLCTVAVATYEPLP